jgi:hypothetical protein
LLEGKEEKVWRRGRGRIEEEEEWSRVRGGGVYEQIRAE